MKRLFTLLLTFVLGVVALVFWFQTTKRGDSENANQSRFEKNRMMSDGRPDDRSSAHSKKIRPYMTPRLEREISKSIGRADLDAWLESKKGNTRSYAEALVIAGMLTNDLDLIRQGIQTDPNNGHLLFIGSTLGEFSDEERFAMTKRLLEAAPDNALGSYIAAAHLSKTGQTDEAIQLLKDSTEQSKMDDFSMATQLLTEDAYLAAGLSPDAAKFRSYFEMRKGYLFEVNSLVGSLKDTEGSMSPDEASELRSMTASMGQRLGDQSKTGTSVEQLLGMKIELESLKGLPDDAPSPYEGLTVGQVKESIAAERQSVKDVLNNMPVIEDILSNNPDLTRRYVERVGLVGELEASKWLTNEANSGK